jgi:hypothetical protein
VLLEVERFVVGESFFFPSFLSFPKQRKVCTLFFFVFQEFFFPFNLFIYCIFTLIFLIAIFLF